MALFSGILKMKRREHTGTVWFYTPELKKNDFTSRNHTIDFYNAWQWFFFINKLFMDVKNYKK